MKVSPALSLIICTIGMGIDGLAAGDSLAMVRTQLNQMKEQVPQRMLEDCLSVHESLNFDLLATNLAYRAFAEAISNDWRTVLPDFRRLGTNEVDRLAVLGIGKCFDEDFFIAYCEGLAGLLEGGCISGRELEWALASGRTDLDTCLIRRYTESGVRNLATRLKLAFPKNGGWDEILTGQAYTNYVEEVEAGVW